ncbi:MAG: hypothetical protein IBX56_09750 [Methylomicrobium sp.]|nr:hypothetical protein [Methylomicrobium sp.]
MLIHGDQTSQQQQTDRQTINGGNDVLPIQKLSGNDDKAQINDQINIARLIQLQQLQAQGRHKQGRTAIDPPFASMMSDQQTDTDQHQHRSGHPFRQTIRITNTAKTPNPQHPKKYG